MKRLLRFVVTLPLYPLTLFFDLVLTLGITIVIIAPLFYLACAVYDVLSTTRSDDVNLFKEYRADMRKQFGATYSVLIWAWTGKQ